MGYTAQTATQKKSPRSKWLFVVLTLCLILAGGGGWLVTSRSGLEWLVGIAESQSAGNFSTNGISGSLLGANGMQQLVLRGDGWRVTLQDVQLQWQPTALLLGELKVLQLSARQVKVFSLPSDTLTALPDSLSLPLAVSVLQMKADSLLVFNGEGAAPVFLASDVAARFVSDERRHQLQALRANLPYGDFAGSGEIAVGKPYRLKAQATLDALLPLDGKTERAHFVAKADGDLKLISIKLNANGTGVIVTGTAQVSPLSEMPVSRLQATFSGLDAGRLLDGAPKAVLSGSVDLHGVPSGELEGALQVRNAHAAPLDRNGLPVIGVTSHVRLSSTNLQMQQLDVRLLDNGHITGTSSWAEQGSKLSAQLKVRGIDPAALDTRLPNAHLQGNITLDSVGGEQRATVVLSDGTLDFYGEFMRQGSKLELSSVRLARGGTVLTGHGQLALDRRRSFRFISQLRNLNLTEFAAIPPTKINVGLEVSGILLPEANGTVHINLTDSNFAQQSISGNGHLEFVGVRRVTAAAEVRLGDNRLNLNIAHGIDADRAQLMLDAPKLAQLGIGLGGQLTGHANLYGSVVQPRLQFTLQGSQLTLPDGQSVTALDASGDLASAAMQLNLGVTGYHGIGALNIPEASVKLVGSQAQHIVRASARIARDEDALGELSMKASGGLSDIAQGWQMLQWRGTLDEFVAQGILPFKLLTAAPLTFAKDHFQLGTVDLALSGGQIHLSDTQWTPQRWNTAGHFSGLNVRAVNLQQNTLVSEMFDSMRGLDTISLGGAWEVKAEQYLQGRLQVQHESGDWVIDGKTGLRLGLRNMKVAVRAEQDQLHAVLEANGEHLGEIMVQASMPLTLVDSGWSILPDAPLAGNLHLNLDDLSWLGPILDSNVQSGGQLNLDAELMGTIKTPRLKGIANGVALSLGLLDQGIRLEQGELKVRFESDAVHIDRLVFSAPYLPPPSDQLLEEFTLPASAGQLSASGRIDLEGGSGNLQITAEKLPLAQRADRWIIASGTGKARYANKTLLLNGNIRADAGLINQPLSNRPHWSDDVQIIGQGSAERIGPPSAVEATLNLGEHFYIRASGLEARLEGQLDVHGEPGEPLRVTGVIAAQDALFDAYGQRLQVERGMVNFQGPLDDPGLNILALRKGLDVEAGVEVTGTVRRPTVRLVSTPNVPDGEKLSWIILGRVPESSGVDTSLLLAAASNILGGQSVGQFGQVLGVDEISLSQQVGDDALQSQKVTVAKRLSSRARISYEQGLTEVGGITKFTYTLTPRITIVTRTGTEDALDIFYTFHFY